MSYHGRSHKHYEQRKRRGVQETELMIEKGLLWEVSRGHSIRKLRRIEQFIVFKYAKIMLIINQNK